MPGYTVKSLFTVSGYASVYLEDGLQLYDSEILQMKLNRQGFLKAKGIDLNQQAFLNALEANEDDETTRLVYADWLEENGQNEEAERQRKWAAAKKWLVDLAEANNEEQDPDGYSDYFLGYDHLLELGRECIANKHLGFSCGNNMDMCDALRSNYEEFWKNVSIITGLPLPEGWSNEDSATYEGFRCAC